MEKNKVHLSREDAKQICFRLFNLLVKPFGGNPGNHIEEAYAARVRGKREKESLYGLLVIANTNLKAFELLKLIAADYLDRQEQIPLMLKPFVASVLRGSLQKPKKQGNRAKQTTLIRDAAIFYSIKGLEGAGWKPITRNKVSSHRDSALDIVSECLGEFLGENLSYDAVEKIWSRIKKSPPSIPIIMHAQGISESKKKERLGLTPPGQF